MSQSLPTLYLKRHEDRRIRRGHPWIFSNELDPGRSRPRDLAPGAAVDVRAEDGRLLGSGYANPHSLICVRLLSRRAGVRIDEELLGARLKRALALRERLFEAPFYRLAHGESDDLPGLVVDRYHDVLAVQIGTAGMEAGRGAVIAALEKLLSPRAIVLRNDTPSRALEGLGESIEVAAGDCPDALELRENGARYLVSPLRGQKTGWYFDQRPNRERFARYAAGARVLDVFSYAGGFGISAALGGAASVTCVDTSASALEQARANAALNGVGGIVRTRHGDAFQALRELRSEGERYDLIALDPPAFIPRKKDLESGTEAYRRLNRLALSLLSADGALLSASCSSHLSREGLREALRASAAANRRRLQILEQGHQGPDHPIHPAMPESEYLKVYLARSAAD